MTTRPSAPAIAALALCLTLLAPGAPSTAQGDGGLAAPVLCEPPLSTCRPSFPTDATRPEAWPPDDCPAGHACVCVPSCPECDDCAAQVCVRDPSRECRTACDCEPGLGCFEGRCIAGFAPVYCCESDVCPAGEQCQSKEGPMGVCEPDPSCFERVEKVSRAIAYTVERTNECRADSDCVRVSTDTRCGGTCGAWVNRKLAPHVERAVAWFDRKICEGFVEDGCPYATPGCLATAGRCVEGRCEGVPILPGPPPILEESAVSDALQHLEASP
jgi:hypothetical protein